MLLVVITKIVFLVQLCTNMPALKKARVELQNIRVLPTHVFKV